MEKTSSRRRFVKNASAGLGALSLQAVFKPLEKPAAVQPLKIVCVGGHPDDPESGCGGTLAKLAAHGHEVTIVYLTRGEAGIPGKSHEESATIRTREAEEACKVLKARPVFAGQVDGDTVLNNEWVGKIQHLLGEIRPDIVFTHWPIDSHKDHQVASILTIQSWIRSQQPFSLYFFEVCHGEQTMTFRPTDFIDITDLQEQKRKAVFCHQSQDPPGIYSCGHSIMEEFRGREMGVRAAEGFVRMTGRGKGSDLVF
jgi:LmbE family N-acetylglucosaminyl deacetylase